MDQIKFMLNGAQIEIEADKSWTLLYLLREVLNLTGTKCGCYTGDCGACKVILDGEARNSCLIKIGSLEGRSVETIEGLYHDGALHPIQRAFIESGAIQCGYCTPGMIMAAKALLDCTPNPTDDEICAALSNNLCRCTGYVKIIEAVHMAARLMREQGDSHAG
ncbi:Nicotinate dehydrogenase subunit A [bioreactor metagenome]|uniref:Nicotinate dehydrogenase subunit A n=1 Tax=bioreactor metagenome TaxID=1076179 RepID=A0A645FJN3_9ZZZZ|nr:(2Fe-2S)-binding protein [Christensenella sp.]